MTKLKVEALKEGMVVAADVKNMDNMLLIPSGASLSAKQIGILQAWGISEITVESSAETVDASNPLSGLKPEEVTRLTEETRKGFWKLEENDPVQQEVFRLILHRNARRLLA